MTWQSAKAVADCYLAKMNLPRSLKGAVIRLADYETDEDLKFMKSADEWPLEFHRMVNGAIARDLVKIDIGDYYDWLVEKKLSNNAGNRALFISEKTA